MTQEVPIIDDLFFFQLSALVSIDVSYLNIVYITYQPLTTVCDHRLPYHPEQNRLTLV